jgi:4'-phosphopantetheinyl transferase
LSNICGGEIIQFNLSHSEDLALYGAIASKKIGVDLEYLRPISDALKLARRFFSPQETSAIEQLTGIARERAFLQIWTAKEAYLKAIGDGLSGEMDKLAIDLKIESDLYSFELIGEGKQAKDWYIYNFIPRPNFIATVAIENQQEELSILLN